MSLSKIKAGMLLKKFLIKKNDKMVSINKTFFDLFNELGKSNEKHSEEMQRGFLLAEIAILFKSSGMPKQEKKDLISELEKGVISGKI